MIGGPVRGGLARERVRQAGEFARTVRVSAMPELDAHRRGEGVEHRVVRMSSEGITVSKVRRRPSQSKYAPGLPVTGATGRITSATRVTAECRISRETTKRAA